MVGKNVNIVGKECYPMLTFKWLKVDFFYFPSKGHTHTHLALQKDSRHKKCMPTELSRIFMKYLTVRNKHSIKIEHVKGGRHL